MQQSGAKKFYLQGWQSFLSDPTVPPVMKDAGHKSKPQAAQFAGRCGA